MSAEMEQNSTAISMDAERGKRFRNTIFELIEANESLQSIGRKIDIQQHVEIQPNLIIEAMTGIMDKRIGLLLAMLENEEHLNESMVGQ